MQVWHLGFLLRRELSWDSAPSLGFSFSVTAPPTPAPPAVVGSDLSPAPAARSGFRRNG